MAKEIVVEKSILIIDGYWLFVNPFILGRGISLFVGINEIIT